MASTRSQKRAIKSAVQKANGFDQIASKFMGFVDTGYEPIQDLADRSSRFQQILSKNADIVKGISGGSIVDFMQTLQNDPETRQIFGMNPAQKSDNDKNDIMKMFKSNGNDVFMYFKELYSNHYIEMADLKFMAKFIPALEEAVNTTLDAVCGTDDLSGLINRSIVFDGSVSDPIRTSVLSKINQLEKEMKLQKRLKNNVYKNALVGGQYYIYAISYEELFSNFSKDLADSKNAVANPMNMKSLAGGARATEGLVIDLNSFGVVEESVGVNITPDQLYSIAVEGLEAVDQKDITKGSFVSPSDYINTHLASFKILKSNILYDAMTEIPGIREVAQEAVNDPSYTGLYNKYFGNTNIDYAGIAGDAGVVSASKKNTMAQNNFGIHGTYVRYISPKNMIPVELMNERVGYYYVCSEKRKSNNAVNGLGQANPAANLSKGSGLYNVINLSEDKKTSIIDGVLNTMTSSIMRQFDKKFVEENSNFKKLIADCITYNGYVDNEYRIQFIPAKYVHEFKINENENGEGTSILSGSIFPAKLLLSLMVSRLLNYLNNSMDRQLIYVNKGPVDVYTGNQVQRVVRNIQEGNIAFSDLLNTNMLFNKYGRNSKIVMPVSRDGKKLAEFETQEGANIDMDPAYETKLLNMAIMGTGVPSVIVEYMGAADYAKSIVSGNIKFAKRISSQQGDLEDPTTDLYRQLIEDSDLSDDIKEAVRGKFEFKLSRSKILALTNNVDFLSTFKTFIDTVTSVVGGEDANSVPNYTAIKREFTKGAAREYAPFIEWDALQAMWDNAALKVDPSLEKQNAEMSQQ